MSGRLAAVVVLSLELLGTRAARADAGGGIKQVEPARRTKPMRLDLTWAWPQPTAPPLIPAAGGAAVPNAPAPAAPPAPGADGAQIALAILVTIIGDTAGILVALRAESLWAGMIPMAVAPLGAGAIVCNIGATTRATTEEATPGRGGRCRATLAGALIGAAAGLVPAMLILGSAGPRPNTEDAYHDWSQAQITGVEVALFLYTIGMPIGTIVGYNVGGPTAQTPATMPPVATAPLLTLRF